MAPPDLRTGRKPNKIVSVPDELRRQTHMREREQIVCRWKEETGCDVDPKGYGGKIASFEIYGTGPNVEKAVAAIHTWIHRAATKSSASSIWAKTPAFSNDKWADEELRRREEAQKATFKKAIPQDESTPQFQIKVGWPADLRDARKLPEDAFGISLKGLDPIRTNDKVFISLLKDNVVEICGYSSTNVATAETHYLTAIEKIRTKTFGTTCPTHILLDDEEGSEVILEKIESWWPKQQTHRVAPRLLPNPLMEEPGSFRHSGLPSEHLLAIQQAIKNALKSVQYEKGAFDFVIRFGCFALKNKVMNAPNGPVEMMGDSQIGLKYSTEAFLRGIDGLIDCEIMKWAMIDTDGNDLLARLVAAEDLLEPIPSATWYGYTPDTLKDVRPIFRGTWVFRDPIVTQATPPQRQTGESRGLSAPLLYVVQIEWTDDEDGQYEKMKPRYYRLKPGNAGPVEHMDVKLLELGVAKGWHFSLESMTIVTGKLAPPAIVAFAERVSMKPNYDINAKCHFAQWNNPKMLKMQTGRLDTIYSFGIQHTGYRVELVNMWYPHVPIPCWGVNVRHRDWATHLCQLERLQVGYAAEWGNIIKTFLPDDGIMSTEASEAAHDNDNLGLRKLSISSRCNSDSSIETAPGYGIHILAHKLMGLSTIINDSGGVTIDHPALGVC